MTSTEARDVAAELGRRAETYASDARKFRDAGKLGQPIGGAEHDARWAALYQTIADELRKVRTTLLAGELPSAGGYDCTDPADPAWGDCAYGQKSAQS